MHEYRERLYVPVLWWLLAVLAVAGVGFQLDANVGGLGALVALAVFATAYAAMLVSWGIGRVQVRDGHLAAGRKSLPLAHTGQVVALNEKQFARLRGPDADPAAQLMLRPYLKQGVLVAVSDPIGPAPYWLVASRRPQELAAAIEGGRASCGRDFGPQSGTDRPEHVG